MLSIFSDIYKQFGKTMIFGSFLPSFILFGTAFVFLRLLASLDKNEREIPLLHAINTVTPDGWSFVIFLFICITAAGLLYQLNFFVVRFFEGYYFTDSPFMQRKTARYLREFQAIRRQCENQEIILQTAPPGSRDYHTALVYWNRQMQRLHSEFPLHPDQCMPTHLGNVIRCFEQYPQREYGIETIVVWPRLITQIDARYADIMDDAKASFDFTLNSTVLSAVLSVSLLVLALWAAVVRADADASFVLLAGVVLFAAASRLLYKAAVVRAVGWGTVTSGAFDLYRWQLLKQLGHHQAPLQKSDEKQLWGSISRHILYGEGVGYRDLHYGLGTIATARPDGEPNDNMLLDVARGITRDSANSGLMITVEVHNTHSQTATGITVTDTVLNGYDYQWGSAMANGQPVTVRGTNPYRFQLPDLAGGQSLILTYAVLTGATV